MTEAAWEEIPGEEYEEFWAPFDARYRFRPGVQENGAGIDEPPGSVTIDLGPIFAANGSQFAAGEGAVNSLALLAMTEVFPTDQRLLVLDWQHPSYRFWPHRQALRAKQEWPVEVFPNGDYYIFLTEDMTAGTFGHPWRQTLCIFGTAVRAVYTVELSATTDVLNHRIAVIAVDGDATAVASIRVDTSSLAAGRYAVTATLSSDLLGSDLSTDTTMLAIRR